MKILTLLLLLQGWQEQQEQKNTALLRTVPQLEDLTLHGDTLARKGNYAAALDIYDPIWKKYPNHIVPVSGSLSVGVRRYILEQISKWPAEGIIAYRKRYDPLVEEQYHRARQTRNLELLARIGTEYPFSTAAMDAALLRAELLLDRGSPVEAAHLLELLLKKEPQPAAPVIAARLGLAYSLSGNRLRLESLTRKSKQEWQNQEVLIGRGSVLLVDFLDTLLKETRSQAPVRRSPSIPEWPMMSGTPNGNGIAEKNVPLGRQAWKLTLSPVAYEISNRSRFRFRQQLQDHYFPLFPAVSDGMVYIHNEYTVSALPLFSSGVDLVWSFRQPGLPGSLMFDDRLTHTTTVHDGRVFANLITSLGQAEERLGYVRVKFPFPKRTLFALNAYTGKEIWRRGEKKGGYSFPTAPTPDGNRLYVGGIRQENTTDPFEHHLLCLDSSSGEILWETFIASGLTEINLFGNSTRESFGTPVAIQGDLLFYGTNHGVLAAVNRNTGQLVWVYRYRQLPVLPTRSIQIQKNPLEWVNVPPVLAGGKVIFTATDSRHLHVLEAATGREVWTTRRRTDIHLLYGVQQETVVVGGDTLCFYDLTTGKLRDVFHPRSPGRGRGVLSGEEIYFPTRSGLQHVRLSSRTSSGFTRWKGNQSGGGNLVIVDGAILLAGEASLEAYFDRRNFEKEAEEILARNPDHIGILYRSAVRFSQSGKDEKALPLFQKVLEKGRKSGNPQESRLASASQLRLHRLHFRSGMKALAKNNGPDAKTHFQKAVLLAVDQEGRLKATIPLASMLESAGDPAAAIFHFQELLKISEDLLIARTIRGKISGIVKRHGRGCYAKMEQEAQEELLQARGRGTPEALLEIPPRYPNSLAAEQATLDAVDLLGKLNRIREQVAILREYLREYPESRAVAQVHVDLILLLEKRKQYASALSLLSRLARLWPEHPVRTGNKSLLAKTFVSEQMAREVYRNSGNPSRNIPLLPPLSLVLQHTEKGRGEGLLVRPGGVRPEKLRDTVFLRYRKSFVAVSLDGNRWSLPLDKPLLFTHFQEGYLILGTTTSILRVDPATGKKLWKFTSPVAMREYSLVGNHICYYTSDFRAKRASVVAAVDAMEGEASWRQIFEGDPSSKISGAGDLAVFVTRYPPVLHAYDSETGQPVLKKPMPSGNLLRKILQTSPGQIVLHSPHRFLEAWSLPGGKRMWAVDLGLFSSPIPLASEKKVHLLAQHRGRNIIFAGRIDLETGKFDRLVEKTSLGTIQYAETGKEFVFLVSLSRNRKEFLVSAVDRKSLDTSWTIRFPVSEGNPLPPAVVGDLLVLTRFCRGPNGAFSYRVALLDRGGKSVQNINSEFRYKRPPGFLVQEGRLILSADTEIQVYK